MPAWSSGPTCRSWTSAARSSASRTCSTTWTPPATSASRRSRSTTTWSSRHPWLDGPTALATVTSRSRSLRLATTVALPVVRGPVPLAKQLAAIDVLSGGRLEAGVGPGSSADDYAAVGIDFDERWRRFDESISVLRALWRADAEPFVGRYYSTADLQLEPPPARADGIPIWVGSWGSEAGLRPRRPTRRRLARIRVQHHPRAIWDRVATTARDARDRRQGRSCLPERDRHDVVPHRRRPRRGRTGVAGAARPPRPPGRRRAADEAVVRTRRRVREQAPRARRRRRPRVYVWPVVDEIEQLERFATAVRPAVG